MKLPTNITQVLTGHETQETAFRIESYPYGRLRCTMLKWLEYRKGKGYRLVSLTNDPRRLPEVKWNKPHASTYAALGVMYLDDLGHVQWFSPSMYDDLSNLEEFATVFAAALTGSSQKYELQYLRALATARAARDASKNV